MRWTKEKDDEVFQCLDGLEWVHWESRKWWADGIWLKNPEDARFWVSNRVGIPIGKQKFESLLNIYFRRRYGELATKINILRPTPTYLVIGEKDGLWYPVSKRNSTSCTLYFMPSRGSFEVIPQENWPHGVYCVKEWGIGIEERFDPSGTIEDLFEYWSTLAQDVEGGWELSLALMLPALFRQGSISFMIVGGDYYTQTAFMFRIFSLINGPNTFTDTKSAYRLIYFLWKQGFVYIQRLNRRLASDPKTASCVKFAITGGKVEVRRPRTSMTLDVFTLHAPVFICSAGVKVHEKLATRSLDIHLRDTPLPPYFKDKYRLAPKALMGAFRLFQKAAQVQPPKTFDSSIAYRDWMGWAYRYAYVLGVEDKLLDYLRRADKLSPSYKKG